MLAVGALLGLFAATTAGGCGGGSADDEASLTRQLVIWAKSTVLEGEDIRFANLDSFDPRPPPADTSELLLVSPSGVTSGRRAQLAGDEVARVADLDLEEGRDLACFLTEKAAAHELPQNPEQVVEALVRYFGRDLPQLQLLQLVEKAEDVYRAFYEIESQDSVSADVALAKVCG